MIIDGRKLASQKEKLLLKSCRKLLKKNIIPHCVTFVAREDPEGNFYTQTKTKVCERVGVKLTKKTFSFKDKTDKLRKEIIATSYNPKVNAIMIQKPSQQIINGIFDKGLFSKYWSELTGCISPVKDIDCLSPVSLGRIMQGQFNFLPATVAAIWDILDETTNSVAGKNITVLGFSEIIGKPLSIMLRDRGATVILVGSRTKNLKQFTNISDIIISCVGKPKLITEDMVKPGSVIIDAGTKKIGQSLYGDADFENLVSKVKAITPVPGGVGPLTVINLVANIISSCQK